MDAETRHKLKTNELGEAIERLMTFNDPRLKYWLTAIIVIALAVGAYRLWSWNRSTAVAVAWQELANIDPTGGTTADPVSQLQSMITNNSDRAFQAAARLRLSHALLHKANLAQGNAEGLLRQALETLNAVLADRQVDKAVAASALLMRGAVHENLRDWDAARASYESLKDPRYDGVPSRALAQARLEGMAELAAKIEFTPGNAPEPVGPEIPPGGATTAPASAPAPAPSPATQPAGDPPQP